MKLSVGLNVLSHVKCSSMFKLHSPIDVPHRAARDASGAHHRSATRGLPAQRHHRQIDLNDNFVLRSNIPIHRLSLKTGYACPTDQSPPVLARHAIPHPRNPNEQRIWSRHPRQA